jgi:hypothetical protein
MESIAVSSCSTSSSGIPRLEVAPKVWGTDDIDDWAFAGDSTADRINAMLSGIDRSPNFLG